MDELINPVKHVDPRTRRVRAWGVSLILLLVAGLIWTFGTESQVVRANPTPNPGPLDPQRAMGYLEAVCKLGTRYSGSPGMEAQRELLQKHFEQFECEIKWQPFDAPHPLSGRPVRMQNLIVSMHPEARERVVLCCHFDTRPFPDREVSPTARKGLFVGANDGASGVALFMELAHHLAKVETTYGVDFVFFDGEELVYNEQGKYFLGSEFFARDYRDRPPAHRYVYGILVDMIGDKTLTIYQEQNSLVYAPELVDSVWEVARKLKVREFIPRPKHEIRDDHLPMNDLAKIPTIDIIDFDYNYWHTRKDIPANCSGHSLALVGAVLLEWLQHAPAAPGQ